jgi:hypothetical protein
MLRSYLKEIGEGVALILRRLGNGGQHLGQVLFPCLDQALQRRLSPVPENEEQNGPLLVGVGSEELQIHLH